MNDKDLQDYNHIRAGGSGFIEHPRGLIAVWGKEAVQFLDGMTTNDMKTLEDGREMLSAFPNAQGRLLALVRVLRQDDRFLFETEEATREKLYHNLFRFTFAGDFFVEDLSQQYRYFEIFGPTIALGAPAGILHLTSGRTSGYFVTADSADGFRSEMLANGAAEISGALYETLRIESGMPKYGVDMDETTIVPELGLDGMISYTKGCYVGQEIIARIHFRGHVAKQLAGIVSDADGLSPGAELAAADGKNAGRVTSVTYSPKLEMTAALAYVRYDYLTPGVQLNAGGDLVTVSSLPF